MLAVAWDCAKPWVRNSIQISKMGGRDLPLGPILLSRLCISKNVELGVESSSL